MPFPSLGSFIKELDAQGELLRVTSAVSPILEIAAIADAQSKSPAPTRSEVAASFDPNHADLGGKALLFENVEGSDFPVAINLWGSYHRMEMVLGSDFESIAARIASLTRPVPPRSLGELIAKAKEFLPLLRIPPRSVRKAPCQDVVKLTERGEVDLTRLGIIKAWPLDGDPAAVGYPISARDSGTEKGEGRYITLAGMHTVHADDAGTKKPSSHNIGMYRSQLLDETHLAMHWHMHHDGASHWRSWKKLGKRMPIAICLGGEAILPYAATAPLPPGISELLMAGFLNGRGIPMVQGKTVPIRVPANSEIVIEGWVSTECGPIGWDPDSSKDPLGPGAVFEGPFGDHTGFYSLPDRYPIVEVTAVTHRQEAVYPTTIVGAAPMEDYYLGKATERVFLPLLKTIVHDIDDYHLPLFGCFHNCAAIQICKAYPLQGRRVMHSVWGAGQMAWTKMIIVVDGDVEIHDERAMFKAMLEQCDFRWDLVFAEGPLDILDQAAPELGAGTKIGFDATRKMKGDRLRTDSLEGPGIDSVEEHLAATTGLNVPQGPPTVHPDWGARRVTVIGLPAETAQSIVAQTVLDTWQRLGESSSAADLVLVVDDTVKLDGFDEVLFELTACADPGRDLIVDQATEGRRIAFDATSKAQGTHPSGASVRRYAPKQAMPKSVLEELGSRARAVGLPEDR
jgi:4-hydroxy-3-polyprenylbenzoate decarboxylase